MRGRGLGFVRPGGEAYAPPNAPPSSSAPQSFSRGEFDSRQESYLSSARSRFGGRQRDYFDDDDDEGDGAQPVPAAAAAPEEADPLDAFMAGVEASASASSSHCAKAEYRRFAKQEAGASRAPGAAASEKPAFLDEADDPLEDYLADSAKKARRAEDDGGAGGDDSDDDDDGLEYDASGEVVGKAAKKRIEPLPRVDHGAIAYEPFRRDFWTGNALAAGSGAAPEDSGDDYASLGVTVHAPPDAPPALRPLASFAHAGFAPPLLDAIARAGFARPTRVQAAVLPLALSGRDVVGVAPTGSGKTLAFVWPLVVHAIDQARRHAPAPALPNPRPRSRDR